MKAAHVKYVAGASGVRIELIRNNYQPDFTEGMLKVENTCFETLERPWLQNQRNYSCIPDGEYPCALWERPSNGEIALYLWDVPDRTGIMFHAGNTTADCRGCILVGDRGNRPGVLLGSKAANRDLVALIEPGTHQLVIRPYSARLRRQSSA